MSYSAPRSLVAATTLAACLALAGTASAGTVQVRDDADLLTPAQEAQLRASGARYAFDARVLTDSRFSSRADFDRHVAAQLNAGNMIVVGIDPVHRWSSVHFGNGTRIATSRFTAVENAGDAYFRGSRWDAGFSAILGAAQQSVGTAAAGEAAPGESRGSFPWRYVIFGLLAVGGIALAVRAFRRAQPTLGGGGWNRPPQGYAQGPYGGPPPGPGYGGYGGGYGPGYGPSGGSGLGTGIAGAALGGLAGYALGNAMAHRGEETHGGAASEGGNDTWDAGGSASGWDDGGGGGDFGGGDAGGGGDW